VIEQHLHALVEILVYKFSIKNKRRIPLLYLLMFLFSGALVSSIAFTMPSFTEEQRQKRRTGFVKGFFWGGIFGLAVALFGGEGSDCNFWQAKYSTC
jgi:hypothetical protein